MTSQYEFSAADARRRRVRFRAWHRGTKEMDLILGSFADAHVATMDEADLDSLEALMQAPEQDAYGWITGARPVPPDFDTPLMARLRRHTVPPRGRRER